MTDETKIIAGALYEYFPNALTEVAKASTFGIKAKYQRGIDLNFPGAHEHNTDAMHRHLLAEGRGERLDPESGLLHATHAAWRALCRLEIELRDTQEKPSVLSDLEECVEKEIVKHGN